MEMPLEKQQTQVAKILPKNVGGITQINLMTVYTKCLNPPLEHNYPPQFILFILWIARTGPIIEAVFKELISCGTVDGDHHGKRGFR